MDWDAALSLALSQLRSSDNKTRAIGISSLSNLLTTSPSETKPPATTTERPDGTPKKKKRRNKNEEFALNAQQKSHLLEGLLAHVNDGEAADVSRVEACRLITHLLGGEARRSMREPSALKWDNMIAHKDSNTDHTSFHGIESLEENAQIDRSVSKDKPKRERKKRQRSWTLGPKKEKTPYEVQETKRVQSKPGLVGVLLGSRSKAAKVDATSDKKLGYQIPVMWYPESLKRHLPANKRSKRNENKRDDLMAERGKLPSIKTTFQSHVSESIPSPSSPSSPSSPGQERSPATIEKATFKVSSPTSTKGSPKASESLSKHLNNQDELDVDAIEETLAELQQMNDDELRKTLHQEKTLWQKLHQDMQTKRQELPTRFLLGHGLEVSHSREVARKVMERLFVYAGREPLRAPFRKWYEFMLAERFKEFVKYANAEKVRGIIQRMVDGKKRLAWEQWIRVIEYNRHQELIQAALAVQRRRRGKLGRIRFQEHRERWYAARKIQTWHRALNARQEYQRTLKMISLIQKNQRMWRVQRMLRVWHKSATRFQTLPRMIKHRWFFLELKQATLKIQTVHRGVLGRKRFKQLMHQYVIRFQDEWNAGYTLTMWWRSITAKLRVEDIRKQDTIKEQAALKIQLAWYVFKDQFSSFLMMRAYLVADEVEKLEKKLRKKVNRNDTATVIQSMMRNAYARTLLSRLRLEYNAARTVQALARSFVARQKVKRFQRFLAKVVLLQRFVRRALQYNAKYARRIQRFFRMLLSIRQPEYVFVSREYEETTEGLQVELLRLENIAATRIACFYRVRHACRELSRRKSAILIERYVRGFLARRLRSKLRQETCHSVVQSYVDGLVSRVHREVSASLFKRAEKGACNIQAWYRGCKQRHNLKMLKKWLALRNKSATKIQKITRGRRCRRILTEERKRDKRIRTNRYRSLVVPAQVAESAILHASAFYHPWDTFAGMHPCEWLHLLGLGEYWDGLHNGTSKVKDLSKLMTLSEQALRDGGVLKDEDVDLILKMQKITRKKPHEKKENLTEEEASLLARTALMTNRDEISALFLHYYPDQSTRAQNFAQRIPLNRVSKLQLEKHFARFKDRPKEAKDYADEYLLTLADEKGVREWELTRFKKCFHLYEMALETIQARQLTNELKDVVRDSIRRANRPTVKGTRRGCNELFVGLSMVIKLTRAANAVQRVVRGKLARALFHASLAKKRYHEQLLQGGILRANWLREKEREAKEWEAYNEACKRYEVERRLAFVVRSGFRAEWDMYSRAYYYVNENDESDARWTQPTYSYEEDCAVVTMQCFVRCFLARQERARLELENEKKLEDMREQWAWEARASERLNLVTFRISVDELFPDIRDEDGVLLEEQDLGTKLPDDSFAVVEDEYRLGFSLSWRSYKREKPTWKQAHEKATANVQEKERCLEQLQKELSSAEEELTRLLEREARGQHSGDRWFRFVRGGKDLSKILTNTIPFEEQTQEQWQLAIFSDAKHSAEQEQEPEIILSDAKHPAEHEQESDQLQQQQQASQQRIAKFVHRSSGKELTKTHWLELALMEQEDFSESKVLSERQSMSLEDELSRALESAIFEQQHLPFLANVLEQDPDANSYDIKTKRKKQSGAASKVQAFLRGYSVRRRWKKRALKDLTIKLSRQVDSLERQTTRARMKLAGLFVGVKLSSEYTFSDMPFGWYENRDGYGRRFYSSILTGESVWDRPNYQWEEEKSAKTIQRIFRGWQGRRAFLQAVQSEGILDLIHTAVQKANKLAWFGYRCPFTQREEGVSVGMWFARRGLYHILKETLSFDVNQRKTLLRKFASLVVPEQDIPWTREKLKHRVGVVKDDLVDQVLRYQEKYASKSEEEEKEELWPLASGEVSRDMFAQFYPNQGARAVKFSEQAVEISKTPVTKRQLMEHLEKYKGKPSLATVQLQEEVFNIPTSSSTEEEEAAYYVLVGAAKRLMVITANLHVDTLYTFLKARTSLALSILLERGRDGEPIHVSSSEPKTLPPGPWHCCRRWPRTATAAFIVRDALSHVLRCERMAVKIQRKFRDYYSLQQWRAMAAWYRSKVIMIQCAWRMYAARRLIEYRHAQFWSSWEELFDGGQQAFYYFDNRTEQSQWEPPPVPYKPFGWWPPHPDDIPVPEGLCFICKAEEAVRRCNECINKNGVKREFCFECFSQIHDFGGREYAKHTFDPVVVRATGSENSGSVPLLCSQCGGAASRKCCECIDIYCLSCFRRLHSRGKRKAHEWVSYKTTAVGCVECEREVATLRCQDCDELYCNGCFEELHRKGHRREHQAEELPSQVLKQSSSSK